MTRAPTSTCEPLAPKVLPDDTLVVFISDTPIGGDPSHTIFESPTELAGRFGSVPRHYICTTEDRNIPLAAQDGMIARVDEELGSKTQQHKLHASHSPFYSRPQALTDVLVRIAEQYA